MGSKLKMCFHALFGALLLVAAPAWAQNGTITGVVTREGTGEPVTAATVTAFTSAGRPAGTAYATSSGRYVLTVPAGTYDITVESVGFEPARTAGVTVTAGGTTRADITLPISMFVLNPVAVTVSTGAQSAIKAPASIKVISESDIEAQVAITPTDFLRATPGVDIITQGVQSTNVVARGFNNIFSGSLLTLTDNRLAGVPSLRVNVLHFVPTTSEDIQRMEVVLGPAAALYGPNTASGVLHMITKSPLAAQGTSYSLATGERGVLQQSVRTAQRLGDNVGFKLSGSVLTADEWAYADPDEVAERAKFNADPFFRQDLIRSLGITAAEADARISRIGNRSNDVFRWNAEGRLDWQVAPSATATLQSGITNVSNGIELTGLGAAQVNDWRYVYYQGRFNWNRLFAQVYLNQSDAGDTYLLRTGQPIVDESTLLVGQIRHGFMPVSWQTLTYGVDYFRTNPRTKGTINGQYEDDDETTEVGAYLQSETALHPKVDLVLAGRVDDHSALPDMIFSPRAAVVFKPAEQHALRATYNRAFSTPTSLNQFLDLPTSVPNQTTDPNAAAAARLGYSVRVQGTGTTGFTFRQADGSYLMRSPFTPAGLGGPGQLLPANAATFFPAAVQVLAAQGAFATNPALGQYLGTLQPTGAQIGTNFVAGSSSFPIAALDLAPIAPIRETTTTTYEVGYKGIFNNRFSFTADGWLTNIDDFVTPLTVSTPLLAMNGQDIAAYLVPRFMTDLGMSQAQATATAAALAPGLARVPVGVISTPEINASGAQLLATYTNVPETLELWGVDLSLQTLITPQWSITVAGSLVSDDHFESDQVGTVTLNAPKRKGSLALAYRPEAGVRGELRARYNDEFPVKSGVYEATACIDDDTTALPCVDSYTLLDMTLGYDFRRADGLSIQLSVQNLLDEDYRSFPGVPNVGRMALVRLRYEF